MVNWSAHSRSRLRSHHRLGRLGHHGSSQPASHRSETNLGPRGKIVFGLIYGSLIAIVGRLFFWQIVQGSQLRAAAQDQYQRVITQAAPRGNIYTSDGFLLVGNGTAYRLVAYPPQLNRSNEEVVGLLKPYLLPEIKTYREASEAAIKQELENSLTQTLTQRLSKHEAAWVPLHGKISTETKQQLEKLELPFLGFEPESIRVYPEASMAAHVVGFVGKNDQGEAVGYFGVEGGLNQELSGRSRQSILSTDGLGLSLFTPHHEQTTTAGRDIVLTIRRDLQFVTETMLAQGLERYGAVAGEIIIMEPSTGRVLAMASQPKYDPATFNDFSSDLYKNPTLTALYEPGSVLKTLTVSAGLDTGMITPETLCPICDGPRQIDKYTIKTWNNQYHPHISMTEALAKSDNVAMIYIAEQLGTDRFQSYLQDFGLGTAVGIDLQEDHQPPFPEKWGPVELATRSFGQGIIVNSVQMVQAVAAIANHGTLMQPRIVEKVIEPTGEELPVEPRSVRQVIRPETAQQVTEMMVHAAKSGEAQWTYSNTHSVAGKTGTSQIPKPDGGGYEDDATIASFIGFAPPDQPRFVMMVKLVRPQTSPWAAETAAPLWYKTAEKVFLLLNIPADQ